MIQPPFLALAPSAQTVNRRSLRRCLRAALRADVLVLGGGSLLQDSTSFSSLIYYLLLMTVARLGGAEVVLWGQGPWTLAASDQSPHGSHSVAPLQGSELEGSDLL